MMAAAIFEATLSAEQARDLARLMTIVDVLELG